MKDGPYLTRDRYSKHIDEKKVQVGKNQEKAQSEKDSHSKNRDGTYTMKTYRKLNGQLFSQ